jgi:hypothetical protein
LRDLCAGCRRPIVDRAALDLIDGNRIHCSPDNDCLIQHDQRWRAAARRALIAFDIKPPGESAASPQLSGTHGATHEGG